MSELPATAVRRPLAGGKKRLFFALWPAADVRLEMTMAATRVLATTGAAAVPPDNYHITLAFLGSVSASSVADIVRVVRHVRFLPFEVSLDHSGYWPRSEVAWLAPPECPQPLSALVDDIWNKLTDLGFSRDSSRYQPHVTLARKLDDGARMHLPEPVIWPVASFALVESTMAQTGPVYTVLEQFDAGD